MIPILAVYTYEDRKCSSLSNLAAGTERDLVGKLIMWSHSDDKVRVVDVSQWILSENRIPRRHPILIIGL